MKKRNPIRDTVTRFVSARRGRIPKSKITINQFFEDLENRGPAVMNSWFEIWTQGIKSEMKSEGLWIFGDEQENINFIIEYISRLQRKFWEAYPAPYSEIDIITDARRGCVMARPQRSAFRSVYLKIRIWGLRMKKYGLCAWSNDMLLVSYLRRYNNEPYYKNSLYTQYQMWSSSFFDESALNRSFVINPSGIKIPWRKSI